MTDAEMIEALDYAACTNTFLVACCSFDPRKLDGVLLDTQELADKLLLSLFNLPSNFEKFRSAYDYVAVWRGHSFYAAILNNGHKLTKENFIRYLEEMDA